MLIHINARAIHRSDNFMMWQPVTTAPFGSELELAVLDHEGPHALAFACQRILGGWMKSETRERIDVRPTHWRLWVEAQPRVSASS